ncbi:hypothetical protein HQN64_24485 [Enterobacteriaceae bacterium BIT-l23]|uniref:Imm50 family immunity protein n=1 Tax=Jejubacter sp. L23 TaxID=3092086 RepID=UPI00158474CD|nr:hypothetical protein [Enterobacteriaceae bacterium BIT-l23]
MWFQNAMGGDKIRFMFGGDFDIKNIELGSITLERFSDLKINFFHKGLPQNHPEKWDGKGYNALSFIITFGDMVELKLSGSKVGFFCSPKISSMSDFSEIIVNENDLELYCRSKFLTIESIEPYIDERWG